MRRKFPGLLLRLFISVTLFLFLLSQVDLHILFQGIRNTRISPLLIALAFYPFAPIVCAMKWRYLARALGVNGDLKPMVGLYFMGMFLNLFLPTGIGGDITRGLYLNPDSGKTRISFLSVMTEKGTGLVSSIVLSSLVMLTSYGASLPWILRYGFPAATALILIGLSILPWILSKTRTKMRELVCTDLIILWKKPEIGLVSVLYSALVYAILVAIHVCIANALSLKIPVPYHFITISLASLASLLPSFNGIGVRDGTYLYLLSLIGIDTAHGLLFAVLWFMVLAISTFIGFMVYLIRGLSPTTSRSVANQKE